MEEPRQDGPAKVSVRSKTKLPRGIYVRGECFWFRYKGRRGSLEVPVSMGVRKALEAFGCKVKAITDERIHGKKPVASTKTLSDLFDKYMELHGNRIASAENTKIYRNTLTKYFGATTVLAAIASEQVADFKAHRINVDAVSAMTA